MFAYLPGAKNGIADALSRRPELKPETKQFHDLLTPSFNDTSYSLRVAEINPTDDLMAKVIAGYAKDKFVQDVKEVIAHREQTVSSTRVTEKQFKPFFEENGIIWYQGATDVHPRIVVPSVIEIKHRIIREVHDTNYGGHPGVNRTYLKLRENWYWPRMVRTIKKYIWDCEACRRNKPRLTKASGLLEPL